MKFKTVSSMDALVFNRDVERALKEGWRFVGDPRSHQEGSNRYYVAFMLKCEGFPPDTSTIYAK